MKQKFSTSWIKSKQIRKQRKYRYNAPLHTRHKFLSAILSKELRKEHGKRNIPVRKDDEVLIMRGSFAKKKGKVLNVDLKKERVSIENISRTKKDGSKVAAYFHPSKLMIVSLNKEDQKRFGKNKTKSDKPKKEEKKNAPKKN